MEMYMKEQLERLAGKSPCHKRKVGCIIFNTQKQEMVSAGYNFNTEQRRCEDEEGNTLEEVRHAEIDALINLDSFQNAKGDLVAYVSHAPCDRCYNELVSRCSAVHVIEGLSPRWPDREFFEKKDKPEVKEVKSEVNDEVKEYPPEVVATAVGNILDTRRGTHGDFGLSSDFVQVFKNHARKAPNWKDMNSAEHEAIDMIIHKLGRWLFGKSIDDHNDDICGYATLAKEHK